MNRSPLLTDILNEFWMLTPEAVTAHFPLIVALLKGQKIKMVEKTEMQIPAMSFAGYINPGRPEKIAEFPKGSVAILGMTGVMTKYDGLCNYGSMTYANLIDYLATQDNISGLAIDVDGPGGAVNAIAPLVRSMTNFKKKKPLVVHADTIASAHYFVGIHGNHLMLDNYISSMAGSIGVVYEYADYSELLKKEGVNIRRIYPPESDHKNKPFEEMEEGNDELIKEKLLSPLAQKFQQTVKEQRGSKLNLEIEGLLSGGMFFAPEAKEYGLVDSIGSLADAVELVSSLVEARKFMNNY